jgi:hypothetical protein
MLDRGYGAVGVAINSAPTEGVPVVLLSQLKSTFPVPRTVGFTLEQWRYAFTKTFTRASSEFDCAVLDLVRVCCVCEREPVRRQPASLSRGRAPWDTEWDGARGIAPRTVPERGTPGASLQPSFTSWLSYRRAFSFLAVGR